MKKLTKEWATLFLTAAKCADGAVVRAGKGQIKAAFKDCAERFCENGFSENLSDQKLKSLSFFKERFYAEIGEFRFVFFAPEIKETDFLIPFRAKENYTLMVAEGYKEFRTEELHFLFRNDKNDLFALTVCGDKTEIRRD
jgi:hypothetical protein